MSFKDVAIVSVKGNDYRIHFLYMSKDESINVLTNADLTEKSERYETLFFVKQDLLLNIENG